MHENPVDPPREALAIVIDSLKHVARIACVVLEFRATHLAQT
jgi:hypothetical protein